MLELPGDEAISLFKKFLVLFIGKKCTILKKKWISFVNPPQ